MAHQSGCVICGKELVYSTDNQSLKCYYCGKTIEANASCADGHFVCDSCHGSSANDLIERFCLQSGSTDPISMAIELMKSPLFNMHGPEHHFLVPAVLLTAYHNLNDKGSQDLPAQLAKARKRAEIVPGGFCGFQGACGAGIGTGIFLSVVTQTTPVSKETWGLSNLMTSKSLCAIAEQGGPRCCKRDTFLAIQTAVAFTREHFGATWQVSEPIVCTFYGMNKECQYQECGFFPARKVRD